MVVWIEDSFIISVLFNNDVLTLVDSKEWGIWMRDTRGLSQNTIRAFAKSMDRFWAWSLYNPIGVDEFFASYQARYRKALREGFEITIEVFPENDGFEDPVHITVLTSKPLSKTTVNKEIGGINSYFYFTEESELIEDHRFINYLHERHKASRSFLAGVQVKKSPLALQASGSRVKYLPPYKVARNRQKIKYFPMELFDELLAISKPREKLLYLLCGACAARIGQALNFTLYDIDYERKEIWLIDPKSDDKDINGKKRRAWLKEEYQIDMMEANEHNKPEMQFKYPIPLMHEPLYWLNDKYRLLFFETLNAYMKSETYVSEYTRYPKHPFFFTTKTGRRLHARNAHSRFKSALRKLYNLHPEEKYDKLHDYGIHSLRHMFGHARAELYARSGDETIPYITMNEMGHKNFESTMVYFNISRETMRNLLEKYMEETNMKVGDKT